jgi:predicted P-loop ATPase
MKHDTFFEDDQFVISYELLHVLHWLLKYEEAEMSRLITQAFIKGCEDKIHQQDVYAKIQHSDELQNSVVNFFSFLEEHIAAISNSENNRKIMDQNIIKALDHIDPKRFDYETIKSTVLATAEKINPKSKKNPKDLFLKELLRQWNPKKEKSNTTYSN